MNVRSNIQIAVVALGFTVCAIPGLALAAAPSSAVTAAVASSTRPEADRARDADRKPAEVIAFAGIGPGAKVSEISPGGGYFTRIFSKIVGEKGVVYALVAARPANAPAPAAGAAPPPPSPIQAIASDPDYSNVKIVTMDVTAPSPEPVDFVWTSLSYHDIHNRPNADLMAFNKMAFNALKPGGTYIVIDHAAVDGSGKRDTSTLHRIDPLLVKSEVVAAGFTFVGESDLLRNPADARDKGVREALRGKTDQFTYKFMKPR
jgi:predicted methyltransferase